MTHEPAGAPSRESGALLDAFRDAVLRQESPGRPMKSSKRLALARETDAARKAVEDHVSTLERDAARMREAIETVLPALQGLASATRMHHEPETEAAFRRDDARAALYALRAALTPSREPTTTPSDATE